MKRWLPVIVAAGALVAALYFALKPSGKEPATTKATPPTDGGQKA